MATEWEALGSAIYSRLSAVTGSGTVPIYQDLAPQGGTPPYVVFQRMPVTGDEYTWGSGKEITSLYIVKAVSNRQWATEAERTYALYEPQLQHAALTVTGYNLLRCERRGPIHYRDPDGFWHCGGEFVVEIQAMP